MTYVRKHEIAWHDGILPCDISLRDLRIMIPVTFHNYIIIKWMIHQERCHLFKHLILHIILRKKSDIQIGGLDINPVSLRRIKRIQSLRHVLRRIWILQTVSENNHVMRDVTAILKIQITVRSHPLSAAGHHSQCHQHQCNFISHNAIFYLRRQSSRQIAVYSKSIRLFTETGLSDI